MKSHDPFKHLQRDIGHEAASLLLYINMAQAVQVACTYLNNEKDFEPLKFMGGSEGCDKWIDEQMAIMRDDEIFKVDSLFN